MKEYLDLLEKVLVHGETRDNRTGVKTLSLFAEPVRFDLRDGFPLVTTKAVHFKSVVHELLWMLSGSSNTKYLEDNGVTIWDEWSRASYRLEMGYPDGELGPVYGSQWRFWPKLVRSEQFGISVEGHVDQIAEVVNKLRYNPDDRRIILSAWNVGDVHNMKLPPCHFAAQFYVDSERGLHCLMNIRSWDLFLGGPFNIAQYALLTHMFAHVSNLSAASLTIMAGDVHLYENCVDQAKLQLTRTPKQSPKLILAPSVHEIDEFQYSDIVVHGYDPHPAIKAQVAV